MDDHDKEIGFNRSRAAAGRREAASASFVNDESMKRVIAAYQKGSRDELIEAVRELRDGAGNFAMFAVHKAAGSLLALYRQGEPDPAAVAAAFENLKKNYELAGETIQRTIEHHLGKSTDRPTILIVDDIAVNRVLLKKIFSTEYNIIEASNGVEALNKMRERPGISVTILDIMMPELDGYGVLDAMRADPLISEIPVVVVTASEGEESEIEALNHGALDVIQKPYRPKIIEHRVHNLVARRETDRLIEKNRLYERFIWQSRMDERTGIYNKRAFCSETLALLKTHPDENYLIFRWDIDRFKVFNDVYGVSEGDRFLRSIGDAYLRFSDNSRMTYGHWSADHFVTCMSEEDFKKHRVAKQIEHFSYAEKPDFEFQTRVGVYRIEDRSLDISLMCDRALLALKSIKNSYTDHIAYFTESMRAALLEEQELVGEMSSALANGEFVAYYQPQFDYSRSALHGAEALVRWLHPKKGLIPPSKFIPVFERSGFVSRLDECVWEQVCAFQRRMLDAGARIVPISVNVSRIDLYNGRLADTLLGLIKKYGLDPSLLRLEITEGAYMEDPEQLTKAVEGLQKLGFSMEMDDFGSGYSSLNTLNSVPVDMLKLDLRFLKSGQDSARSGNILSSVVRMAHWLRLPVIAEGVETREQADYLKSIGCSLMQGYYFGYPAPAGEFEALLKSERPHLPEPPGAETDIKGAVQFLDASTQATLLFNSFVGGAEILEYDGARLEALRVNDQFYRMIGSAREEYEGLEKNVFARFYPESRAALERALEESAKTGEEAQCELHSLPIREDRADFWTSVRIRFLAKNGNRRVYYLCAENITGQKELEKMRLRLADIVRNVPAGIAIYELSGGLIPIFISERGRRIFGYSAAECDERIRMRRPMSAFGESMGLPASRLNALKKGDILDLPPFPVKRRDGTAFYLRIVASLVARRNAPPLVYATFFDVTEQREHEEERRILIDAMPGGLFKYRADGEGAFTFLSENTLGMLGYTREEFQTKFHNRFPLMVYEPDRARVLGEIDRQIAENGSRDHCEYRIERRDGSLAWVYDEGHLVKDADGTGYFYVLIVDISERRALEEKLSAEVKKAEALIRNLDVFAWEYDVVNGTHTKLSAFQASFPPLRVEGAPESLIESGLISPESAGEYRRIHREIRAGHESASAGILLRVERGGPYVYRRIVYRALFEEGRVVAAIGTAIKEEPPRD